MVVCVECFNDIKQMLHDGKQNTKVEMLVLCDSPQGVESWAAEQGRADGQGGVAEQQAQHGEEGHTRQVFHNSHDCLIISQPAWYL